MSTLSRAPEDKIMELTLDDTSTEESVNDPEYVHLQVDDASPEKMIPLTT